VDNTVPLDSLAQLFLIFVIPLERASLPLGEDREAGANPALPRNCKRGNLPQATGSESFLEIPGKALVMADAEHPYS
jgi:hypothetical protein